MPTLRDRLDWKMEIDDQGHRNYWVWHLVHCDVEDGPYNISQTPGLPVVGAIWNYGADVDPWAFCYPTRKFDRWQGIDGEKHEWWRVENFFSTRPRASCQEDQVEDPLLIPDRKSGSFIKYTKEVTKNRHGRYITTSSHELLTGPLVEFDHNRHTVRIEQNVAVLDLSLCSSLADHVNNSPMWGVPARCVKLSNFSWREHFYGSCSKYFERILDFDVDRNTFDREGLDQGTKVLNGHWDPCTGAWVLDSVVITEGCGSSAGSSDVGLPDKNNPQHFIRYKDRNDENCRVILNGSGVPADSFVITPGTATPDVAGGPAGSVDIEYYPEGDLFLLGVPVDLEA